MASGLRHPAIRELQTLFSVGTTAALGDGPLLERFTMLQGEAAAANNVGTIYRDEGRLRLALRWFEKAAAMGDGDALLEMARLQAGPLQDTAEARKLLSRVLKSKRATLDSREDAERLLRTLEQRERLSRPRRSRP